MRQPESLDEIEEWDEDGIDEQIVAGADEDDDLVEDDDEE